MPSSVLTPKRRSIASAELGLPSDGIAGAYTYAALRNLAHSWVARRPPHSPCAIWASPVQPMYSGATPCLFGTDEFSRAVASRMSNVAQAAIPPQIISADALGTAGRVHDARARAAGVRPDARGRVPLVSYAGRGYARLRLASAVDVAATQLAPRVSAAPRHHVARGRPRRSAQHYAITLLDALCSRLAGVDDR